MQPGPCIVCGKRNYPLSAGGPSICPRCDCGLPPEPAPVVPIVLHSMGCICPPGANKECQNPNCPRKPFPLMTGVSMTAIQSDP